LKKEGSGLKYKLQLNAAAMKQNTAFIGAAKQVIIGYTGNAVERILEDYN
jgi:hypothetical protein